MSKRGRVVFHDYGANVQRLLTKMARASTDAAARVIERDARANIAVDTGESRKSIGRERVSDTKVRVGAETPAAFHLETRATSVKWESYRWLEPAFREGRDAASEAAVRAARRAMR